MTFAIAISDKARRNKFSNEAIIDVTFHASQGSGLNSVDKKLLNPL